jgi:hypothetical protein
VSLRAGVNVMEKIKFFNQPGIEPRPSSSLPGHLSSPYFSYIVFLAKYYYCGKIKENEVGGTCSTHTSILKCHRILIGNLQSVTTRKYRGKCDDNIKINPKITVA